MIGSKNCIYCKNGILQPVSSDYEAAILHVYKNGSEKLYQLHECDNPFCGFSAFFKRGSMERPRDFVEP